MRPCSQVTVDKKNDGRLFYWMMESRHDPAKDPVLLWLNGYVASRVECGSGGVCVC